MLIRMNQNRPSASVFLAGVTLGGVVACFAIRMSYQDVLTGYSEYDIHISTKSIEELVQRWFVFISKWSDLIKYSQVQSLSDSNNSKLRSVCSGHSNELFLGGWLVFLLALVYLTSQNDRLQCRKAIRLCGTAVAVILSVALPGDGSSWQPRLVYECLPLSALLAEIFCISMAEITAGDVAKSAIKCIAPRAKDLEPDEKANS